jgi:ribosomal protein L24
MLKKQKIHVKVGDIVIIISGFHKNETGEIIKINKKQEKFL